MRNRTCKHTYNRYGWALLLLLASCSGGKNSQPAEEEQGIVTALPEQTSTVTVMELKRKNFDHELVSNGKVEAKQYADLSFRVTSEPVAQVYVKNGDRVSKGQKIAELALFTLDNQLQQAQTSLAQAELEMQDVLIGQGYAPDRIQDVPAAIRELAETRSGYAQSRANYELAQYEREQAILTAPFDGVIANLTGKRFHKPDASQPFCRVIGTGNMEVAFTVLESELPLINEGDRVEVTPYAATLPACKGRISEINPLVDENGMVKVKATVESANRLFDGMNVRRSGKQVVFTLKDGKAMWNYVQTGLENMTEYTVTGDGMEEGAQVIVSGNVNLAHEAPVVVREGK